MIDASAIIAQVRREPGWERVDELLDGKEAVATTVNMAEVAQRFAKAGFTREQVDLLIAELGISPVAPDLALAVDAGTMIAATARRGLSLADRFCLALARREGAVALTADRAWTEIADAVGVSVETIR